MQLIENLLTMLSKDKRGHVLVVEGEQGVGKSRLLEELETAINKLGICQGKNPAVRVVRGRGNTLEHLTPYFAIKDVIFSLIEVYVEEMYVHLKKQLESRKNQRQGIRLTSCK